MAAAAKSGSNQNQEGTKSSILVFCIGSRGPSMYLGHLLLGILAESGIGNGAAKTQTGLRLALY